MVQADSLVIYWDASALLSVLFEDSHSTAARSRVQKDAIHFLSTLAYTETCAVIGRIQRQGDLPEAPIIAARETLARGPWRRLNLNPDWDDVQPLSIKWRLRGADLWHLATAKRLQRALPELFLLSFDARLLEAAKGEGLAI